MFEQSTRTEGPASKRVFGACVGFAGQAALVSVAIVAPMVFPQILPRATLITNLTAPGPPPPPRAPGKVLIRPRGEHRAVTQFRAGELIAPNAVPPRARILEDPEPVALGPGVYGGLPIAGGRESGHGSVLDSILSDGTPAVPPRAAPTRTDPAARSVQAQIPRVPVGGIVKMAKLLFRVEPVYPVLARQMRVAGVVELEGVIGIDGRLVQLRVKAGHPMLARAAIDAVRQWVYEPTTLNGKPVEVIAPITVTFILN